MTVGYYYPRALLGDHFDIEVRDIGRAMTAVTHNLGPNLPEIALYCERGPGPLDVALGNQAAGMLSVIARKVAAAGRVPDVVNLSVPVLGGAERPVYFHRAPDEDFPGIRSGAEVWHAAVDFDGTYDPTTCCQEGDGPQGGEDVALAPECVEALHDLMLETGFVGSPRNVAWANPAEVLAGLFPEDGTPDR